MKIEEDMEKLNENISSLCNKIEEHKEKIKILVNDKREKADEFLKNGIDIPDSLMEVSKKIEKYLSGDNSYENLRKSLRKLYDTSFNGIVGGRIKTNVTLPDNLKHYNHEDNLWINTKGLSFKWKESKSYWEPEYYKRTKCFTDWKDIKQLIVDNPKLTKFIKRSDKKKIYTAFYNCLKDWKELYGIKKEWNYKIYIPKFEEGYSNGITSASFKEATRIKATLNYRGIRLDFDGGGYYSSKQIDLGSELDLEELYILSQLNEEVIKGINGIVNEVKGIYDKDLKLYETLKNDLAPYIFQRMI